MRSARGLVHITGLVRRIDAYAGRAPTGVSELRALLMDRSTGLTGSPLELRFLKLLRAARMPTPQRQYEIRRAGAFVARVDFAFVEERVAVEIDGYAYHAGRKSFVADKDRDARIIDAGWFPMHFTKKQIMDAPDKTIGTVRRTLSRRSADRKRPQSRTSDQ